MNLFQYIILVDIYTENSVLQKHVIGKVNSTLIAFSEIKSVGEIKSLGKESIMMILHIVICKAVRTKLHKSVKGQLLYELS